MNREATHRPGRGATVRRRGLTAAGAVVVASVLLAGCAEEVPTPRPEPASEGPALSQDQEAAVLEQVGAVLGEGTESGDPAVLKPRVTGPALEVRTSQLAVAKVRGDTDLVTEIPSSYAQLVSPTATEWPRTAYAITEATENLETNRLVVLEQADARADYRMWAWVQLVPGVTMPAFADAQLGSESVAPDDASLAVTPADALARYADVLTKGPEESEHGDAFDLLDADLVNRVQADASNLRNSDSFKEAAGKYSISFEPRKDDVRAVRTADGGAVVVGVVVGSELVQAEPEAKVPPLTRTQEALLDGKEPTNVLRTEYTDMVALYVPPSGSEDKIRPLGYSHVATKAANE
ncbi:hypothetical protein [Isoptericola variabilis]|uniref:DUF8094 domain-containing protein n=1 Tax=Isoptericola variabilis (strain 225) TaxID=743718 RepID=F6FR18_ISOV2|nr:hypothetical protein [Isoptericola variabilis]AEG44968.1 hypothetical protein Isova_2248 [Isoptericola variabilis 225]TWH26020.1 hypothetical protein L600_000800000310 [Isoptericola variabilis J7]